MTLHSYVDRCDVDIFLFTFFLLTYKNAIMIGLAHDDVLKIAAL